MPDFAFGSLVFFGISHTTSKTFKPWAWETTYYNAAGEKVGSSTTYKPTSAWETSYYDAAGEKVGTSTTYKATSAWETNYYSITGEKIGTSTTYKPVGWETNYYRAASEYGAAGEKIGTSTTYKSTSAWESTFQLKVLHENIRKPTEAKVSSETVQSYEPSSSSVRYPYVSPYKTARLVTSYSPILSTQPLRKPMVEIKHTSTNNSNNDCCPCVIL